MDSDEQFPNPAEAPKGPARAGRVSHRPGRGQGKGALAREWTALRPTGAGAGRLGRIVFERRANVLRLGIALVVAVISAIDPSRDSVDIALTGVLGLTGIGVALALGFPLRERGLRNLGLAVTLIDSGVSVGFVFGSLQSTAGDLWTVVLVPTLELAYRYGAIGGTLGGIGAAVTGMGWTLGRGSGSSAGVLATTIGFRMGVMLLIGAGGGILISRVNKRSSALGRTLDLSPDIVSILGLDGTILYVNRACHEVLGYGPEELVGRPFWALQLPEDRPPAGTAVPWRTVVDRTKLVEGRLVRRDGTVVWFEHSSVPLPHEGIVHCVSRDITERRKAELEKHQAAAALEENQDRLQMTLEQTGTFIWEYDVGSGQLGVSDTFTRSFGLGSRTPLRSADEFMERIHSEDRDQLLSNMVAAVEGVRRAFDVEFRMMDLDGRWRWISTRCRVLADEPGHRRLVGIGTDVTPRRSAMEALARSEAAFQATIETTTDAFIGVDAAGRVTEWNPAAESMFGWEREEMIGERIAERIIPLDYRDEHLSAFSAAVEKGYATKSTHRRFEVRGRRRDGHIFPVEVTVTSVAGSGGPRFHAFVRDMTEQHAYEEELSARALSDGLTGLPNRTHLMSRLEQSVARLDRSPGKVAVMFVDLDHFKDINDSLGHGAGDQLLASLARNLSGAMRTSDTVARFGGDELIVLCEQVADRAELEGLASRLLEAVSRPIAVEDREVVLHASIGIAVTDRADAEPETLIEEADAAMYRAKERGRGRFELFDEDMKTRASAHFAMESELRKAIDDGQLRLHFQPLLSIPDERVVGAEALLRWQHPTKGLVLPAEFLAVAEETGLILRIGEWVLDESCRQVASWRERYPDAETPTLCINLSGRQLMQADLAKVVRTALQRHDLEPSSICLEATESVLVDVAARARETLAGLRELGVPILIDDFGTGYSSLANLRTYPVSGLKIDQTFVAGLGSDPADEAIVEAVIAMAHALGMMVIAEGVQTGAQLEVLDQLHCDMAQGFYWSHAREEEGFEAVLNLLELAGTGTVARLRGPGSVPPIPSLGADDSPTGGRSEHPPSPPAAANI